MMRPAPSNQRVASAQLEFAVCQNTRSHTNAAMKNAIGNGINIGWTGWPAILAVLRGFRVRGAIVIVRLQLFVIASLKHASPPVRAKPRRRTAVQFRSWQFSP